MAKEFKHFDTMFSSAEIKDCRKTWFARYDLWIKNTYHTLDKWDLSVQSWTNVEVREAVYMRKDSIEWQAFRVSLKGLETRDKLKMLLARFNHVYIDAQDGEQKRIEKCRIDNYILALVRGGQLNSSLEVVR